MSIPYGSWLRASEVIGPKVSQRLLSGMRPGGTNGSIASVVLLQRMQKRPISSGSFEVWSGPARTAQGDDCLGAQQSLILLN